MKKKITKVNNGYVYEMEDYVETPKSLYELIEGLGDDYSIFREMIMERNQLTFDKEASKIIGVDETGSNGDRTGRISASALESGKWFAGACSGNEKSAAGWKSRLQL